MAKSNIAADTRTKAERFARDHGAELQAEVAVYATPARMAPGKSLELFSIPQTELAGRAQAFSTALDQLAAGENFNQEAIRDGLNIVAGMVRITGNAATLAAPASDVGNVTRKFRDRNDLADEKLSLRDKSHIQKVAASNRATIAPLAQDAAEWKSAAATIIDIAKAAGVNTEGYADGLGITSRFQS